MAVAVGVQSRHQLQQQLLDICKLGATFRDTAAECERAIQASTMPGEVQLEPSIRLHMLIEDLARDIDGGNTDRQLLAQFLSAEYTLFAFTSSVELPLNAYLIHWLESISTWEKRLDRLVAGDGRGKASQASVEQQQVALVARLELVQRLLMDPACLRSLGDTTAHSFLQRVPPVDRYVKFDVRHWLSESISQQSIIWADETSMATFREMITSVCPLEQEIARPLDLTNLHKRASAEEVYKLLQQDPDAVRLAMLRMPFAEIHTFDLFNRLLDFDLDSALAKTGSSKQQLIRDFLQSALNSLETQSEPAEVHVLAPASDEDFPNQYARSGMATAVRSMAADREREARAVQLVATFIKGLLRSGHVVWTDIEWQLKELTARYSWVAEVKELPRLE